MYMRRCLTSLVIKEIQIKAVMKNHFFHFSNWQNFQCGCGEMATLVPCWWDNRSVKKYISGRHFWKAFRNPWQSSKMCITLESAIQLLGIYPKETLEDVPKDVCAVMFISALFIIAKRWKWLNGPSIENWLHQLWFIHIMESYADIKTDDVHLCPLASKEPHDPLNS